MHSTTRGLSPEDQQIADHLVAHPSADPGEVARRFTGVFNHPVTEQQVGQVAEKATVRSYFPAFPIGRMRRTMKG
jgi:hypothetical protein